MLKVDTPSILLQSDTFISDLQLLPKCGVRGCVTKKREQAGAELCQAQQSLSYLLAIS